MKYEDMRFTYEYKDISGQRFGGLEVKVRDLYRPDGYFWICWCDCGKITSVAHGLLVKPNGRRSCGCSCGDMNRIPFKIKRLYQIWNGMRQRCQNPKDENYFRYGGRGITVCDQWQDYRNFHKDVIEGYANNLTLDRINNNGNYEPGNFRWITQGMQSRNTSRTKLNEDSVKFIRENPKIKMRHLKKMFPAASETALRNVRRGVSWK